MKELFYNMEVKRQNKSKPPRDETLDRIINISEIVAELIKAYDRGDKINLNKVQIL